MKTRLLLAVPLLGLATLSTGCLMAGNYHSARTLEKGTSEFGMTFGVTKYTFTETDSSGNQEELSISAPNLIPEITYHIGVKDNVEVGGRVALQVGAIEADAKFRIYHDAKTHIALAPAIGYQGLFFVEGGILSLPAIITYDLAENFSINLSAFGRSTRFQTTGDFDGALAWEGTWVSTGGSVGFDIRGETFVIRPSVEFARQVAHFGDEDIEPFNTMSVQVHLGFIGGREKKQLNRMERKLDRVIENQEGQPQGGTPAETDDSDYQPNDTIK